MSFASLSRNRQVAQLRPLAFAALKQFGIEAAKLWLLNHGFNTTFGVIDLKGKKFALRLNTNSHRSETELAAEVAWVRDLAQESDLWVPHPQPLLAGGYIADIPNDLLQKPLKSVLYDWLPGPLAGAKMCPQIAREFGVALRKLHTHAASFTLRPAARLRPLDNCLFNLPYALDQNAPELNHSLFREVHEGADRIMARVMKGALIPIHYDLHPGNAKWFHGKLSVFDFDDAMMGRPILDIAITAFYLRNKGLAMDAPLWEGLGSSPEDHGVSRAEFETLVASRAVGLANELFRLNTADLVELAPKYAVVVQKRLEHFQETGSFDPTVARIG
jgi:Ser/Thr protein kinase RdoA (MazF antagonist)